MGVVGGVKSDARRMRDFHSLHVGGELGQLVSMVLYLGFGRIWRVELKARRDAAEAKNVRCRRGASQCSADTRGV